MADKGELSEHPPHSGSRRPPRSQPIRRRLTLLLLIPLTSLVALWGVAANLTLSAAIQRSDYDTVYDAVGQPVNLALAMVQQERAAAALAISDEAAGAERYRQIRARTDGALADFRRKALTPEVRELTGGSLIGTQTGSLSRSFDGIGPLRSQVDSGTVNALEAVDGYSRITETALQTLSTMANIDDGEAFRHTVALTNAYWSRDYMMRQDALITSLPRSGRMSAAAQSAFARWAGSGNQLFAVAQAGLAGDLARHIRGLARSEEYARYRSLEERITGTGSAAGVAADWRATIDALSPRWLEASTRAANELNDQIGPAGRRIMLQLGLAGGVGLLAVALSILLSLTFARRLTTELLALQRAAQSLAHERLPRVVARLRRGESVDIAAEAPPMEPSRIREIERVAEAFGTVQRTAVDTAVGEAELRKGVNRVFINLSWRSQSLLHRQLRLLDAMERRAGSAEELADLFKLDHLTTRMRRHAEGLVILSGSPTVRAWDHPVEAEDLIRAALAEVEDYTRVEVTANTTAAVTGTVVADVIHLLAELIENAATFSPPSTEVTVRADSVANGLAIDVVDRGIGLQPDQLSELNRRLSHAAEFDLADTDRLGLFVVSRLAARHGIKVSLQSSPYGGTTAIVLVPNTLVVVAGDRDPRSRTTPVPRQPVAAAGPSDTVPPPAPLPAAPPPAPPVPPPAGQGPWAGEGPWSRDVRTGEFAAESSEITGRLPKRVRQQSLAPQLRERPAPPGAAAAVPREFDEFGDLDDPDDEPTPELSRDLMSSLQSGWARGRGPDDDDHDGDGAELEPHDERGER
ncbi:nitrate- and nitrite sensing domain-containing protein [Actinomadura sp. 21ATH]|uniref:sensor histidine kinase n=1 Tax=Actinomadura sp. 21ATH TaxID=1735444 RepID=UPI0035BF976E